MDKKTKALIQELTDGLLEASNRVAECACTCADRSQGHEKSCSGISYTKEYDLLVEKATNFLREEKKAASASFPMEYKGWKIEIKMGREFKGSRGSVKGKRGYIATRIADGKVREYPPTYDVSPSLSGVKAVIDVEERSTELQTKS